MSEGTSVLRTSVRSIDAQPPLPRDRFIVEDQPDDEAVPMDVVFVGGGPGGLAGAIELARLVQADNEAGGGIGDVEIGVLEKAGQLGEHSLSGAVVNPSAFQELFPELFESWTEPYANLPPAPDKPARRACSRRNRSTRMRAGSFALSGR